ncbi:MAG: S1C family serine protease [Treponema sp.]|nr:S1C family serine protease [Treponema sp.]
MKKNLLLLSAIFLFFNLFSSCKSAKKAEPLHKIIDYTDEDVVNNEISQIKRLMPQNPVKALWRALKLGREELINECYDYVKLQFNAALEENDYYEALRYIKSLDSAAIKDVSSDLEALSKLLEKAPVYEKAEPENLPQTITDCINATVTVWVDRGFKVENGVGSADVVLGSGFFIDKRGYIITNYHVIDAMVDSKYEGFSRLYIRLPSDMDNKIPAKVVGYDPIMDLALLKVEMIPDYVFELGSSRDLAVGDKVSAIGTPIGLEGTLTSGIVSSIERKLMTLGYVFQIDTAVNSGNSGGPLIDESHKVQAIVFAGMMPYQGLNFAIPVEFLKQELELLYKGGEFNHIWIGAYGRTKKLGSRKCGLEILYVMPGSSAAFAGLRKGDIIKALDGNAVASLEDFQFLQLSYQPGTMLNCVYERDGLENKVLLYMDKRPEAPLKEVYKSDIIADAFLPIFGMKLLPSSTLNKKSYKIEELLNGSTADELGFSVNDPITIREVKLEDEKEYLIAQVFVQRRKKGFLNIGLVLSAPYDSPYYF